MSKIDVSKLTNAVKKDGKTVARCPACVARGGDAKGNNLVVYDDGKFGCAASPKDKDHNRMILQLVGVKEVKPGVYHVPVRRVQHAPSQVIKVVGRFGRSSASAPAAEITKEAPVQNTASDAPTASEPCPQRPAEPSADPTAEEPPASSEEPLKPKSKLDEYLASKGLHWKKCDDVSLTLPEPKKSKKTRPKPAASTS
jgi:hypothetical protein